MNYNDTENNNLNDNVSLTLNEQPEKEQQTDVIEEPKRKKPPLVLFIISLLFFLVNVYFVISYAVTLAGIEGAEGLGLIVIIPAFLIITGVAGIISLSTGIPSLIISIKRKYVVIAVISALIILLSIACVVSIIVLPSIMV